MFRQINRWFKAVAYFVGGSLFIIFLMRARWSCLLAWASGTAWYDFISDFLEYVGIYWIFILFPFLLLDNDFRHIRLSHLHPRKQLYFPVYWFWFWLGGFFTAIAFASNLALFSILIMFLIFLLLGIDWDQFHQVAVLKPNANETYLKSQLRTYNRTSEECFLGLMVERWANTEQGKHAEDLIGVDGCIGEIIDIINEDFSDATGHVIGVLNQIGSGKTSIVESVKSRLEQDRKFFVISVSCWEFESSHSIEDFILKKIASIVNTYIFAPRLSMLSQYWLDQARKIANTKSYFQILSLFASTSSFEKCMEELSEILEICDMHFVIIIDDVDRNKGFGFKLKSLQRLIELLKKYVKRMSFIVVGDDKAVEQKKGVFDFQRLLDKQVQVPSIDGAIIAQMLSILIKMRSAHAREARLFLKSLLGNEKNETQIERIETGEFIRAFMNPKKLKSFVFRLIDGWKRVEGEVLFGDYFLITFLHIFYGKIISFLNCYITIIFAFEYGSTNIDEEMRRRILGEWKKVYRKYSFKDQLVIRKNIKLLFPLCCEQIFDFGFSSECSYARYKLNNQIFLTQKSWAAAYSGRYDVL